MKNGPPYLLLLLVFFLLFIELRLHGRVRSSVAKAFIFFFL